MLMLGKHAIVKEQLVDRRNGSVNVEEDLDKHGTCHHMLEETVHEFPAGVHDAAESLIAKGTSSETRATAHLPDSSKSQKKSTMPSCTSLGSQDLADRSV
eukprot:CAMPEP_0115377972 /NCGR_PEP_ID=MMETSP0271-20121206/3772_1 /TAXON_ID=71861 /ORGANISM="Scrippsiella trochoidea, Strain CCMP3099" /LENGTH=99 /DNA_ID=CAMNT_0002801121 /DNA_START=539 /DNA_END=839 /DNA_ORIENTATION=+